MQYFGNGIDVNAQIITIGLGWDNNNSDELDLDVSAFLLSKNKLMPRDDYLVFYNNLKSYDNSTILHGDNRTGGNNHTKDSEEITVNLDKVDKNIVEIIFTATIFKALERNQNFGQFKNSYIKIYNSLSNEIIAKYPEILQMHGFYMDDDLNLITFDLIIDFDANRGEVKDKVLKDITDDWLTKSISEYADISKDDFAKFSSVSSIDALKELRKPIFLKVFEEVRGQHLAE